jgi:hypothetical protein
MFGHNSFVWTPVKVFNAGTEAPAGHTGSFLYVSQGVDGRGPTWQLYNEDESPYYLPNYQVHSNWNSKESAIESIPDGIYYKVETPSPFVAPDPAGDCRDNLNRTSNQVRIGTTTDGSPQWGIECGNCLSGYVEDDTGTCIVEVIEDEEEEQGTNLLMIGGGIAGVLALAFFGMG